VARRRRREVDDGRLELLHDAWAAARLDDVRRRLWGTRVRSEATTAALDRLSVEDAWWMVEFAEGRSDEPGSADEVLARRASR
jgi:hypothetical protein